jgi:hypothetical protein
MRKLTASAFLLLLVPAMCVFAQTSNATLGGTVSDASGALIPGVTVTATNTRTGIVTTVLSNEAGAYQFASLQTGTYKVSADLAGFQTQTYNNVILGLSQQVRLNFTLPVGGIAQSVEVSVAADTLIATTSSSVGSVLPDTAVRDLPLSTRSVMDLVFTAAGTGPQGYTTAGEGNFAGGRISQTNVTRDGFVVSDGRYSFGAWSATYTSPDLVEEVRVITAPVDAEGSRGSGQVQMVTRSGTNQFRGSAFWTNHNSALDASNWFNNFNGIKKDYNNRNQFGARLGGPIIKNKTFFFVLIDEQRDMFKQTTVGTVLTPLARQGIFRFFPGVDSQNITQNNPTVDRNGNPVKPGNVTGELQQFSIFTKSDGTVRDPNRPGYDLTGFIPNVLLARMPLPNDYTVGDGLNTAGIRFNRPVYGLDSDVGNGLDLNRDQLNFRVDHNFNANHKLSVVYTFENDCCHTPSSGLPSWPGGYYGEAKRTPRLFTTSLVSTLSSSLVNELRVGYKRSSLFGQAPFYAGRNADGTGAPTGAGLEAFNLLPVNNSVPYEPVTTLFVNNFINDTLPGNRTRGAISPLYTYSDTLSWTKGKHAFKGGVELRFGHSDGWNDVYMIPQVFLGAGGVPVSNIDNIAVPGLSANNQTTARNLLTDLAGSVASIQEGFDVKSPTDTTFHGWNDGVKLQYRDFHGNEFSGFFKDTWKVHPALTLNLGIHYDWFGVPYEGHGLAAKPVGAEAGLCGISCGALTSVQFVGKDSPNPGIRLFNNDWNNFAPSVGLSWSLPRFGKDKTVLRAGYGWSYTGGLKTVGDVYSMAGALPGTFAGSSNVSGITYTSPNYLSLASVALPIPQQFAPLQPDPSNGSRTDNMAGASTSRPSPYIQNFNFEIQRELAQNFTLTAAYVGTKGTRLWAGIPLNSVDIFHNNFLSAFNTTQAGGNAPLFDQMLKGLNIPGAGVVNGTTVTGSAALRAFTSTRAFIANGNVGGLADFLNRSTSVTGQGGGFVRNSGLFPENLFVINPQFNSVTLYSNPSSSTYHSMQIQLTKRLSHGVTSSTAYTWSRALGDNDTDGAVTYLDPNNRSLNKALLGFHRTKILTTSGTLELPFGANRPFLNNASGLIMRFLERWQLGGIFNFSSGAPLTITAPISTFTQATAVSTPNIVGAIPKSMGKVTEVANGVTYFARTQQITDPALASVSSLNGLSGAFSNKAITDASGKPLLVNPQAGQNGDLGLKWIEGPTFGELDMNLIKRVRITEIKEFEFRLDAVNVLNHPNFDNPNLSIDSTSFGRITSSTAPNRRFVINARVNF